MRAVYTIAVLMTACELGAQGTRPDTLLQRQVRQWLDTIARDRSAPGYSKRGQAKIDSLTRLHLKPIAPPDTTPPPPPNGAPTASFAKSYDPTTRTVAVNAGASKDDKAITGYAWKFGDGATGTGVTATHRYQASGTFNIELEVRDAEGLASTVSQQQSVAGDTVIQPPPDSLALIAELPRSVPAFAIPPPTRIVAVTGDLQAALDNAQRGDELRLTGTFTGNYTVSSCAAGWITVKGATTLPADGVRITPTTAATFAKIITPNYEPAIATRGPACRWRFIGIEVIATHEGTGVNDLGYGIIRFGEGGDVQNTLAKVPVDFVLSHSYVHGAPLHNNTRCVVLNSANSIIRDSWISDCHARGSDSQAILIWNSPGPFLIENNRLEGAGENFMSGGADPGIAGLIPSDITLRRNHIIKPLSWKGGQWSIKNLVELKNARRVDLDANVSENSWPASQEGMAYVFKSSKDSCTTCTWQGTVDVTVRWNIVRNAAVGLNLQARDGPTTLPVARVVVTQNWFDKIGAEGRAALMLLTHDLTDISITSNTFAHDPSVGTSRGAAMITDYASGAARRMEWRGNLMGHGAYGFFYNGAIGTAALDAMIGDGSWRMVGNTIVGATDLAPRYPPGNVWLNAWPSPPAPGADVAELLRRTAGVVVAP